MDDQHGQSTAYPNRPGASAGPILTEAALLEKVLWLNPVVARASTIKRRTREECMNRRTVLGLGAVTALGALARDLHVPAFAQQKVVLKATDVHPLGYPTVEAVVAMGKKLEAATSGRLSLQMYPSMQLGGEKEMIEQAQVGALAIARVSVGPMGTLVPEL